MERENFEYAELARERSKVASESGVLQNGTQSSSPRFPTLTRLLRRFGVGAENAKNEAQNSETETLEASKTEEKPKEEYPPVSYFQLYKYATNLDKLYMFIAVIFCAIAAASNSLFPPIFGDVTGVIVEYVATVMNSTNQTDLGKAEERLNDGLIKFVIYSCLLGVSITIACYFSTLLFSYSALRQTYRIRHLFLAKVLNQDISWYDLHKTGDFASRVADDLKKLEEGIGEKVSVVIFNEIMFLTCAIQGLIKGWELALICMISFPAAAISIGFVAWISSKFSKAEMEAYGDAGAVAEEALSSVRTVVAFGGQAKEQQKYDNLLVSAKENNIKRSLFNGISMGLLWFFTYSSYSLSFWYGVKLILKERDYPVEERVYDPATMVTVFFSVLSATWAFGMVAPMFETFGMAKGGAAKIFGVIASQHVINTSKGKGVKPSKIEGNIVFKDVQFSYPSRPDVKVLQGFNLAIKTGETVALVGSSGCGKSTCIQLIQRYYDPDAGSIYIDDNKLTELDLTWIRSHIGVVGQEPVLFETTIAENIKLGCKNATHEDIEKAAKKANAHTFITALPQGYDTVVGERGAQLSGGQKQRIAIARALVREPSILLLDEATSALDTRSEAVVQAALDAASHEYTTIIVAHRLSTVKNADRIVVISEGQVQEEGTHDELMAKKGAYHELISAQVSSEEIGNEQVAAESDEKAAFLRQKSVDVTNGTASNILSDEDTNARQTKDTKPKSSSLLAMIKLNKPEWWIITIGCIASAINGAGMPLYAIVFGDVLGVLAASDPEYVQNETNKFCIYFLVIGIVSGICTLIQIYTLGVAGENLTMKLRSGMFKTFLAQEMGWFDIKDHGVGSLCAQLSGEPASVQGATGQRIGTILNAGSTIIITLGISLCYEWRIALISMCFTPAIIFCIYLEQKFMTQESKGHHDALQKSTKIAVEGINGIRTVASLGCENTFHDLYMKELIPYQNAAKRNSHVRGLVYGFSRSLMFFNYAAAIYYGVQLVKNEGLVYSRVFTVTQSLVGMSWSLGAAMAFTPNFQKGIIAANRIFEVLSRVSKILDGSDDVTEKWEKGNINYENVYFSYPSRPTVTVLKDLDLSVLQGKTVALVGPSGCGKSTIVQLLERFYDPSDGAVTADGNRIDSMNLLALRSHLGIVSQEPNLFSKTIAENIAYGDNTRTVGRDEIIEAARKANIHSFITSLPMGYDTPLGEKGTQLSGGQKQRIAIARALVRNPRVLLLDEATSALDAESEKVVQEALDNAKKGRTCISIAHRLTTIQDADLICVINHGKVAEMGTHSELLGLRGLYYNLHSLQNGRN